MTIYYTNNLTLNKDRWLHSCFWRDEKTDQVSLKVKVNGCSIKTWPIPYFLVVWDMLYATFVIIWPSPLCVNEGLSRWELHLPSFSTLLHLMDNNVLPLGKLLSSLLFIALAAVIVTTREQVLIPFLLCLCPSTDSWWALLLPQWGPYISSPCYIPRLEWELFLDIPLQFPNEIANIAAVHLQSRWPTCLMKE